MIEPFINFSGRAAEAIDFYETAFGGTDKQVMKMGDMPANPDVPLPEGMKDWVGFAKLTICGSRVNFSDTQENVSANGMISLTIRFNEPDEVLAIYEKLRDGGVVRMEAEPQFFAKMYAWVEDKFGVNWQLICE